MYLIIFYFWYFSTFYIIVGQKHCRVHWHSFSPQSTFNIFGILSYIVYLMHNMLEKKKIGICSRYLGNIRIWQWNLDPKCQTRKRLETKSLRFETLQKGSEYMHDGGTNPEVRDRIDMAVDLMGADKSLRTIVKQRKQEWNGHVAHSSSDQRHPAILQKGPVYEGKTTSQPGSTRQNHESWLLICWQQSNLLTVTKEIKMVWPCNPKLPTIKDILQGTLPGGKKSGRKPGRKPGRYRKQYDILVMKRKHEVWQICRLPSSSNRHGLHGDKYQSEVPKILPRLVQELLDLT